MYNVKKHFKNKSRGDEGVPRILLLAANFVILESEKIFNQQNVCKGKNLVMFFF